MAQFGKRNTMATQPVLAPGTPRPGTPPRDTHGSGGASRRPNASRTDVSAALAVVKSGKVPAWTTFGPLHLVILALCMAAVLWHVTATYAGEIWRDHRLAGTWQTAYDLRAVDGSCRRVQLVITFCSANIKSLAEPERAPVVSEFMTGFSSGGGEAMMPVRSTVDPSAVAIAYAAETQLVNRTLTWLVLATTLAALLICVVNALLRGRYKGGRAHRSLLDGLAELQARVATTQAAQRAAP
jgi:hypothetical protein